MGHQCIAKPLFNVLGVSVTEHDESLEVRFLLSGSSPEQGLIGFLSLAYDAVVWLGKSDLRWCKVGP